MGTTGEIMGNIKVDYYTAKEAMERVVEYMKLESIQTIELITSETVRCYQNSDKWNEDIFDMTFAGNKTVLEMLGTKDERLLKEAESHLFLKMFFRFLHKNHSKVFLLAENEEILKKLQEIFKGRASGAKIVETATFEEHGLSDDMILNRINGVEVECVLAAMDSPHQQEFIARNKMLINTRIWVGLGTDFAQKRSWVRQLKERLNQYFTKS